MSSVVVPRRADLSLSTGMPASPRLHELRLDSRLNELRAIVRYLLTELESLGQPAAPEPDAELHLDDEVKRYEMALIRAALDKAGGSQTRAARMLGVKVTTLNTKIKRYQIMRCPRVSLCKPLRQQSESTVPRVGEPTLIRFDRS